MESDPRALPTHATGSGVAPAELSAAFRARVPAYASQRLLPQQELDALWPVIVEQASEMPNGCWAPQSADEVAGTSGP